MIKVINEVDIFSARQDIIALVANCHGYYDRGFALRIKRNMPDIYYKHYEYCERHIDNLSIMGTCFISDCGDFHRLASLFVQFEFSAIETDYIAFESALILLRDVAIKNEQKIAIPFQFDVSNEEWVKMEEIIDRVMPEDLIFMYSSYLGFGELR